MFKVAGNDTTPKELKQEILLGKKRIQHDSNQDKPIGIKETQD